MMNIICSPDGLCIKSWCNNPEAGAIEQARNLAKLPFAFKHIALMPDTHKGYGMPIGCVLATKNVVVPNAVGVDIGCGMCALSTNLTEIDSSKLKSIMRVIRKLIPVGFSKHDKKQITSLNTCPSFVAGGIVEREWENALYSLGTLGGGNHFIEIQKGSDGFIWIMVHSGSRSLGKKVADYYNDMAINYNTKWFSSVPIEYDLAFLPFDDDLGQDYINEMMSCVNYAYDNRSLMLHRIMEAFSECLGGYDGFNNYSSLDVPHNYLRMENHFGNNLLIHRKGAIDADAGLLGIIPGSQGTSSYITKGKGNRDSFTSSSHGAGRRMGRKEAERSLNLATEIASLNDKGIIHSIRSAKDLDEAPSAYKDITTVMEEQSDLTSIVVELKPLAVIKG